MIHKSRRRSRPSDGSVGSSRSRAGRYPRVQQGSRRQPRRDRGPRVPRRQRARGEDRRRLPARGPHVEHRFKADEAYQIGEAGTRCAPTSHRRDGAGRARVGRRRRLPGLRIPVREPRLRPGVRRRRAHLHRPACRGAARRPATRSRALKAARAAGMPVLARRHPRRTDATSSSPRPTSIGFPIFVKAVAGGGGRGMRRVEKPRTCPSSLDAAMREAESAFGDPTVFLEQAVLAPRHIEVQILADGEGNVVHLYERDCSVQRRHQKVVEIAPAPNLDPAIRDALCARRREVRRQHRLRQRRHRRVPRRPGGAAGKHVFIEMNPRIQVEHTVTEEVTDIDIVSAQMRIAAGATLADSASARRTCTSTASRSSAASPPRTPRTASARTPAASPRTARRAAPASASTAARAFGGRRDQRPLRLDAREAHVPRPRLPHRRHARPARARRVPHPRRDDEHPVPAECARRARLPPGASRPPSSTSGRSCSGRAAGRPRHQAARATWPKTVNQPHGPGAAPRRPRRQAARGSTRRRAAGRLAAATARSRARGLRAALRAQTARGVTDTTFRDAHQSLLATRVRTYDLLAAAGTRRAADPAAAVRRVLGRRDLRRRAAVPRRGPVASARRAARGHAEHCAADAAARPQHRRLHAVPGRGHRRRSSRRRARPASTSSGSSTRSTTSSRCARRSRRCAPPARRSPRRALLHQRPHRPGREALHARLLPAARRALVDAGAHMLAIKDMAGLLRAPAARTLVSALRERFDVPVHLHTHDTAGGQLATLLAAIEAGVDAVDVASAAMAGTTQPCHERARRGHRAHRARHRPRLRRGCDLEPYWEAVRQLYAPFESGLPWPTGRVYDHEIPGGQLSNLRQQAIALGLGEKFEADRGHVRRGQPHARPPRQGDAERPRSSGTSRSQLVGARRRPGRLRGRPRRATTSRTA